MTAWSRLCDHCGSHEDDFTINVRSVKLPAGGVGFVAVDLLHKKEGVAKELIGFFLRACRERGRPLALLYPFRPDFYRRMGFGYGAKICQYRVRPASLPGGSKERVRALTAADKQLLADCYGRYAARRHGLIEKSPAEVDALFADAGHRFVGYQDGGGLAGYLVWSFSPVRHDTFLVNDMLVEELVYESPAALAGLLAFLRTQADQIRQIVFNLQDDSFHHLLHDPRHGSDGFIAQLYQQTNTQGLGSCTASWTRALFAALAGCDFGGAACRLKIAVRDSFFPSNDGELVVHFTDGRPTVRDGGEHDVAIQLDVAELSSLLMGVVDFRALHGYGRSSISDPRHVDTVDRIFRVDERPICMTRF